MLVLQDPEIFSYKTLEVSVGHTYRYIDQWPAQKDAAPIVLCLHGFGFQLEVSNSRPSGKGIPRDSTGLTWVRWHVQHPSTISTIKT
ncbi:hypothetical protein PGTUg99_029766 [Puccinia graminis f. sp. tritici]|uniref:Uncharacterized protein n=1 Tax=Puccinia graminis f. sp. tritici TaxID=56615 RepID=A0A5B0Q9H3_PUCGR|nr:hypothetical protein PGTUg99_029766 [Puccinia graminis f. sp. tritici]